MTCSTCKTDQQITLLILLLLLLLLLFLYHNYCYFKLQDVVSLQLNKRGSQTKLTASAKEKLSKWLWADTRLYQHFRNSEIFDGQKEKF